MPSKSFLVTRLLKLSALAWLLVPSVAPGQALPVVPEAVDPQLAALIDTAIRQSPRMLMRNADAAAAEADLMVAKSSRLPSAGGWAQWVKSDDDRGDFAEPLSVEKFYYSFSINQPLYHWGTITRGIDSAKIRLDIDEGRTRQAYMALVRDVRANYLNLLMRRRGLERARLALTLANANLAEGRTKRAQNTVSEAEIYQLELAQERAALYASGNEDDFLSASRLLARLTGTQPLSAEEVPMDSPVPAVEQDAPRVVSLLARFLADELPSNTDLDSALKEMEIRQNDLHRDKVALRPRLNAVVGATSDEQAYTINVAQKYELKSVYAGVSVSWTVFDGFASRGRVRSSLARLRSAETALELQKATLIDNAESLGRQMKTQAIAVGIAERELVAARNGLDYIRGQQRTGDASEAQVNAATLALHDASGAALYARYNYWNKLSDLLGLIEADPILDRLPANR